MKTLILTRHAKSDWSNLYQKDYDRELNQRGLSDAPMMAKRLLNKNLGIDLLVSSTAKRAAQTVELIALGINFDVNKIVWREDLYHAQPLQIEAVIFEQNNQLNTMLLVCHNNGISDYVNQLLGTVSYEMPTCAMCAFTFETDKWEEIRMAKTALLFYDYPKKV